MTYLQLDLYIKSAVPQDPPLGKEKNLEHATLIKSD